MGYAFEGGRCVVLLEEEVRQPSCFVSMEDDPVVHLVGFLEGEEWQMYRRLSYVPRGVKGQADEFSFFMDQCCVGLSFL